MMSCDKEFMNLAKRLGKGRILRLPGDTYMSQGNCDHVFNLLGAMSMEEPVKFHRTKITVNTRYLELSSLATTQGLAFMITS